MRAPTPTYGSAHDGVAATAPSPLSVLGQPEAVLQVAPHPCLLCVVNRAISGVQSLRCFRQGPHRRGGRDGGPGQDGGTSCCTHHEPRHRGWEDWSWSDPAITMPSGDPSRRVFGRGENDHAHAHAQQPPRTENCRNCQRCGLRQSGWRGRARLDRRRVVAARL